MNASEFAGINDMNRWKWQAISRIAAVYKDRPVAGAVVILLVAGPWATIATVALALLNR